MRNFPKTEDLPLKDLLISGLIIFIVSTLITKIYDPVWGLSYLIGNVLTLSFLNWLYKESWSSDR